MRKSRKYLWGGVLCLAVALSPMILGGAFGATTQQLEKFAIVPVIGWGLFVLCLIFAVVHWIREALVGTIAEGTAKGRGAPAAAAPLAQRVQEDADLVEEKPTRITVETRDGQTKTYRLNTSDPVQLDKARAKIAARGERILREA